MTPMDRMHEWLAKTPGSAIHITVSSDMNFHAEITWHGQVFFTCKPHHSLSYILSELAEGAFTLDKGREL